ncbi:MAG: hypothetical protein ACR2NK_14455 [Mariniblastus sp.]
MNQNIVFTGALRDSFFLRQRFPTMCLVVLMIAGLQGCDVNRNVSGEIQANVDEAVAEVVIVQPDLDRPHSVDNDNSAGSPTVVVAGVESGDHQQEEGKSPDLSSQLPAEPATDAVKDLSEDDSVLSKAGKLVGDAASKSVKSASEAGQWVQDTLGDATQSGTQSAADTWEWANETFESLKSQGLTTAQSTSQWLGQDWKNMESWQYQIVILDGEPTEVARKLNELGEQGWECFEVTDLTETSTKFYLKKPTFSYLRQLPFKDVIKLVPLMNAGEK